MDELLDSKKANNLIEELDESALNDDNKRAGLSRFLMERLYSVSQEMALSELLCIYSALPIIMKLFMHLEKNTAGTYEQVVDILGRLKSLIDCQDDKQNDERMSIQISCLQRIWLQNLHGLYHTLAA